MSIVLVTPGSDGRELWLKRGLVVYLIDSTREDVKLSDFVFELAGGRGAGSNYTARAAKDGTPKPPPGNRVWDARGTGGETICTRALHMDLI